MTRSPGRKLRTALPTASTMPMASWPRMRPDFMPVKVPRMRWRSVPQMAEAVMRTTASLSDLILGSETSSRRMSPTSCHTTASMEGLLEGWLALGEVGPASRACQAMGCGGDMPERKVRS